ncbi:hypothetical protein C0989_003441 [Termitomyces sp. Mn162]|nr:hypothetical protein C0989_003441 [Termitomyces sp. Mn162]
MTIALRPLSYPPATLTCGGTEPLSASKRVQAPNLYHRLYLINQAKPINTLPSEILCQIFETARHSTSESRPWDLPDQRKLLPITISQVSRHWREVALNNPLLWSYIDVSPPWSFPTVCLALSRAQTCPLTINLAIPSIAFGNLLTPSVVNASANIICSLIAPCISRCRKFLINGDFCQLEPLFIAIMETISSTPAPLLKHLVIHPTGVGHLMSKLQLQIFNQGIPILSHLRVTSAMVPSLPSLNTLTALHLAAADRRSITLAEFSVLSTSSPYLDTLAIYDNAICGPWPLDATIDFPSLRSLQIYGSFMSVSDLLRVVQAPLLKDLVIAPFAVNDLAEYREHISHSPPKFTGLKSITLSPVSMSGFAQLEEAAECFPTVELVMIPNIHADSFRDVLTGADADIVWSGLKALALRNIDYKSMEKLLAVVAFREAAGSPLETLYLDHRSMQRVSSMLPLLRRSVNVVEFDVWATLLDEDLLQDAAHFVGNDIDFSYF